MNLGFATPLLTDGPQYLKVPALGLDVCYLNYLAASWDTNLSTANWYGYLPGSDAYNITVPILFGPQSGTVLTGSGSGQTTSPQNPANTTTPTTMTLADVASGVWDAQFTRMFAYIATVQPAAILRIGHEQYGNGWYPWNGVSLTSQYAAAYKHLVGLARAASSSFTFDWNGNVAYAAYDPTVAYPLIGGAYADYMTCDVYDSYSSSGAAGWTAYRDAVLFAALAYAKSNGKPFGFTEFGLFYPGYSGGYGDDPAWLEAVYYWLRQNEADIGFAVYFQNYAGGPTTDGGGALQRNPQSAALFSSLYGSWARELAGGTSHRFVSSGTDRRRVA